MVNEHGQIVCDITKIILEDGVTIYPGYVEVKDGQMFRHFSDDPNNKIDPFLTNSRGERTGKNPAYKVGMLKNRVEYRRTEGPLTPPEGAPDGHYIDLEYLMVGLDMKQKIAETGKVPLPEEVGVTTEVSGAAAPDVLEELPPTPDNTPSTEEGVPETAEDLVPPVEDTPGEETPTPPAPEGEAHCHACQEYRDRAVPEDIEHTFETIEHPYSKPA